jgi:phage/plasmid-associated DNA primase
METRWGAAGIYGTAANIRNEITADGLENVERFKELTGGGDRITAEYKGQDKFEFTVSQKFLFATNEVPSIERADEAFYNRCLFVRFPDTVPESEQDKALQDKLREEKSGILNWMLEGLRRLMDQGQFSGEREVGGKKELCDAFGGVVDRFVHNCLEVTGESNHVAHKGDIHDFAQSYADDIDKDPEWNAQSGFTKTLKQNSGVDDGQSKKLTGSNTKVFTGIKPHPAAVDELDTNVRWTNTTETKQESLDT